MAVYEFWPKQAVMNTNIRPNFETINCISSYELKMDRGAPNSIHRRTRQIANPRREIRSISVGAQPALYALDAAELYVSLFPERWGSDEGATRRRPSSHGGAYASSIWVNDRPFGLSLKEVWHSNHPFRRMEAYPSQPPIQQDITRLLHRWEEGDREAFQEVVTLAYGDLRAIALGYLQRGAAGHTLQATGLVNELYLKLAQVRGTSLKDRNHFYAFAAQLMRMILIDYSRQSKALKRPSSAERVPLHDEMAWIDAASENIIALNTALDELEAIDERKSASLN